VKFPQTQSRFYKGDKDDSSVDKKGEEIIKFPIITNQNLKYEVKTPINRSNVTSTLRNQ